MKITIRLLLSLAFVVALSAVTACNTIEGVGEDLQSAGQGIESAAEDTADAMDD
jgi:predicted small secreted protein